MTVARPKYRFRAGSTNRRWQAIRDWAAVVMLVSLVDGRCKSCHAAVGV